MKFIKVNHNSLKGLIQLRNELVYYISANKLPEFKNEERACSKCPVLTVCSLLGQNDLKESDIQSYSSSIKHLEDSHRKYFFNWYQMLEFEFQDYKQFESGNSLWWKSVEDMEKTGLAVFDLRLELDLRDDNNSQNGCDEYSGEGFFTFKFTKSQK